MNIYQTELLIIQIAICTENISDMPLGSALELIDGIRIHLCKAEVDARNQLWKMLNEEEEGDENGS